MGMLLEGRWTGDNPPRENRSGAFERIDSIYRDRITADGSSGFKAEPGRYHLFVSPNCPWAHRTVIFRKLKKLEDIITMSNSDRPKSQGWAYSAGIDELQPLAENGGTFFLHQAYTATDPQCTSKVTVPTLWDRQKKTIVNNESAEIIRMLNSEFDEWGDASLDFCPGELLGEIDAVNEVIYATLNNGVYRCGFAKSQEAYEEAYYKLFDTLEMMEDRLSRQRYLAGDRMTEADWRAFPTLVRFDAVYFSHFKCNKKRIADYPNMSNYLRELYQVPGVAGTLDIDSIKRGYYGNQRHINPIGIVPVGPDIDYMAPHDRDRLPKAA